MWDWGMQPFATVIVTFVFAVYIVSDGFGPSDRSTLALAVAITAAGVVVALVAPVLGQNSDRSGRTMLNLRILTYAIAGLTALLFFIKPHPSYLLPGLVILGIGIIVHEIGVVNYNSTIEEVAGQRNVGRISGFGWGFGYMGGIVVLLVINFAFISPDVGLFGVTSADGLSIRVSMLVCAAWMLIFTAPIFASLKDKPQTPKVRVNPWAHNNPTWLWAVIGPVAVAYRDLGISIAHLWRTSRQTAWFLLASALFRDGLAAVFSFGGVLAASTFGFSPGEVIMFGAAANIAAGLSTITFGLLDDRLGPRRVILLSLGALVVLGMTIFALHDRGPWVFWVFGMGMTLFVGPAQAASRSYLARLIPVGRSGQIFGLYATTGRVVSFISPALFWLAIVIGEALCHTRDGMQYWGILGIVIVLLAGLVAMFAVKEHHQASFSGAPVATATV